MGATETMKHEHAAGERVERFLASEEALAEFLAAFEDGTWPKPEWTHGAHVAVAACYLRDGGDVLTRTRHAISTYNVAAGGANTPDSGYHETLTRFWLGIVADRLAELPPGTSRLEAVRDVVARYGRRSGLFREYYGFDVVGSREARAGWVAPDLEPFSDAGALAAGPRDAALPVERIDRRR